MKKAIFLLLLANFTFLASCDKDEDRSDPPGVPTTIEGIAIDHYRNIPAAGLTIKLVKFWDCSHGFSPSSCTKEIAVATTDANGHYILNFGYYLRADETYRIMFDESTPYSVEYDDFLEQPAFVSGSQNMLNISAFIPVKVKIHLTALNNYTPPLITGVAFNGKYQFGTNFTYESEPSETFDLLSLPNSTVSIDFWYIVDYTTNHWVRHGVSFPFSTGMTDSEVQNFVIDCNDF